MVTVRERVNAAVSAGVKGSGTVRVKVNHVVSARQGEGGGADGVAARVYARQMGGCA